VLIRREMLARRVNLLEDDLVGSGIEFFEMNPLEPFLSELCRHVYSKGVITLYSETYGPASWDVKKTPEGWAYGTRKEHSRLFRVRILSVLRKDAVMAVVLRSYTGERDSETGIRVKEIRGYRVWLKEEVGFEQIAAEDMVNMSRKDSFTGNDLEPEPAVLYCGPNDDCYDGWLRTRTPRQEGEGDEARI
jgi:hypothetical protein